MNFPLHSRVRAQPAADRARLFLVSGGGVRTLAGSSQNVC